MDFHYETSGCSTFLTAEPSQVSKIPSFHLHMLENFEIGHLFKAIPHKVGEVSCIRYDITGCLSVKDLIAERRFTLPGLAVLTLAALDTVRAGRDYMLTGGSCAFNTEYVFFEARTQTPKFAYIPALQEESCLQQLLSFLRKMTANAELFVPNPDNTDELSQTDECFLGSLRMLARAPQPYAQSLANECRIYLDTRRQLGSDNLPYLPALPEKNSSAKRGCRSDKILFACEMTLLFLLLCVPFAGMFFRWNETRILSVLFAAILVFSAAELLLFRHILSGKQNRDDMDSDRSNNR